MRPSSVTVGTSVGDLRRQSPLLLSFLVVLVVGSAMSGCVSIAEHAKPASLLLFNAHAHLNRDLTAEMLIKWMDQAGVRKMVLMPRHYNDDGWASDEQAAEYAKQYPDRFIAFIGGQRGDLWGQFAWTRDHYFLWAAEQKLKSGQYRGLGEFIIHHYGYNRLVPTTHQHISGDLELPVDSYLMFKIVDLAAKYDVPVVIHAEAEAETSDQMRRLLEKSPRTRIVWAHNCGRAPASQITEFLKTYPNLFCDLGGMVHSHGYGRGWPAGRSNHISVVQYPDGGVNRRMRDLFEAFPDRFVIGTDIAHPFQYPLHGDMIDAFRQLLSQLRPKPARKIGYENAERLFQSRK